MSNQIAEIGFKLDTAPIDKGVASLEKLVPATSEATAGTAKTEAAVGSLVAALTGAITNVEKAAAGILQLTDTFGVAVTNIEKAAAGLTQFGQSVTAVAASAEKAAVANTTLSEGFAAVSTTATGTFAAVSEASVANVELAATASAATATVVEQAAVQSTLSAATKSTTASIVAETAATEASTVAMGGNSFAVETASGFQSTLGDLKKKTTAATLEATAAEEANAAATKATGAAAASAGLGIGAMGIMFGELVIAMGIVLPIVSAVMLAIDKLTSYLKAHIPWAHLAGSAIIAFGNSLTTIAPYAVALAAALALVYAPTIITGIGILISTLAYLTGVVIGLTAAFIALVGWPALVAAGLVALAAVAVAFRDDLTHYLGVDIVGSGKDAANYLINSMLAAFDVIAAAWQKLPAILAAAMLGAVNLVIDGINTLVNKTVEGINFIITQINKIPAISLPQLDTTNLKPVANPYADEVKKWGDETAQIIQKTMGTDRLGQWGKAIGDGATYAAGKVVALGKAIYALGDPKAKKGAKGSIGGYDVSDYDTIVEKAQKAINANQTLINTIGESAENVAEAKRQQELLNDAVQHHITLTDQQRAELMSLGKQWGDTEVAAKKAQAEFDFEKDTVKGFVSDLKQGLEQGKTFWQSFSDAATNALNKITDKLLNDVIDAIFQVGKAANGTAGSGGGLFGMLSNLVGGFFGGPTTGTGGLYAKGGTFGTAQKFGNGGAFTNSVVSSPTLFKFANGGKMGVMGEAGPEAIMPLKRGSDGSLGVQMHAANGNSAGGGNSPNVTVEVTVNGNAQVSQSKQTQPNGDQLIKLMIDTVNQGVQSGKFDKSMGARYATKPVRVFRG